MNINPTIELTLRRCGRCQRYYSHEGQHWQACTHCIGKDMKEQDERHCEKLVHLNAVIRGLRGALKRRAK